MKKISKLLFTIFFIFLINLLYGQKYTVFENFKDSNIIVSENEINYLQNGAILNDSVYFSKEKIRNGIIPVPYFCTIPSSIADILYAHILITTYDVNKNDTLEIQRRIKTLPQIISLCNIGIIPISQEYESYVFMADFFSSSKMNEKKGFYMLNVQKGRLSSIYNIATYSYSPLHDATFYFTIIQSPNILIRKYTYEVSDVVVIYENEEEEQKEKEEKLKYEESKTKYYKLDVQGYIELIGE